jgi:D-3-phosphoglycerate dehydrogenase
VRVAVASRSFSRHPVLRAELAARFPGATFNDAGVSLTGDALVSFLRGHERAIVALERIDEAILAALPELRVVSKYGVGLDMMDLDAMEQRGVALGWTSGVNRRSVAELALSMAIALLHRVPEGVSLVHDGRWQQIAGRQLTGRTVGIIGCGHVGQDLTRLLAPFGCRVLAFDKVDYADFYRAHHVEAVALDRLLADADVVTLHLPLDRSTRGFLSAERLRAMRPGAVLINTARGGLVDEAAVIARLDSGDLAGAAFDVLNAEPPGECALLTHPKVLVTPHIGGSTEEAVLAMGRAAIKGLDEFDRPSAILAAASPSRPGA